MRALLRLCDALGWVLVAITIVFWLVHLALAWSNRALWMVQP